jgi:histidine triad (HIT) family protein
MVDCIFCKIAVGQIPCNKIYEDKDYLAFLDIKPLNPGHVLIIPKKHFRWVYDVDDQAGYWTVAKALAQKMVKSLKAEYAMFVTWGLEVPHAHIHVIPRFDQHNDPGFIDWKNVKQIPADEMKRIAGKLAMK